MCFRAITLDVVLTTLKTIEDHHPYFSLRMTICFTGQSRVSVLHQVDSPTWVRLCMGQQMAKEVQSLKVLHIEKQQNHNSR